MRELKFRAWNKEARELGLFDLSNVCAHGAYIYTDRGNHFDSDMPIMQWTGLKDKNGVDLFEGDLVRYFNIYSNDYVIEEVRYHDGKFLPMVTVEEGYNAIEKYRANDFEVIGNIYEHSHLLEETK